MEDGGVGHELHVEQLRQQGDNLVELVVEVEDVPVPHRGGVVPLLLRATHVSLLALK